MADRVLPSGLVLPPGCRYDPELGDDVVDFFEVALVHTKSKWARKPFVPAPWQADGILRPLFGAVRFDDELEDWVRLYTIAWIEIARKNGKSEILAGCGLRLLTDDEEEGEIYGCACDRDQAKVVYRVVKRMVELSPVLQRMVKRRQLEVIDSQMRIVHHPTGSFYQVVAADGPGNLGVNPYGVLFDEIITQPSRELWDAFRTAEGTRPWWLMLAATTAGNDPSSMAAEEHLHSENVLKDPTIDPARFVFMRNTPTDADWRDEKVWSFANPALGDFKRLQALRDQAKEAATSLSKQNAFRQFQLNQWVRQITRWIDLELWDANAGMVIPERLDHEVCFGGLDLASVHDFTAWVLVFPGQPWTLDRKKASPDSEDRVIARFFLPEAALEKRSSMRDQLEQWRNEGWLKVTPGDVVDQDAILAQIDADAQRFDIRAVGYDRWNATQLVEDCRDAGMQMEPVAQTCSVLNGPSKELERRLGLRKLRHGGNPILRWMADNVQTRSDVNGNIKPDRKASSEKIDGIAALVDAVFVEMSMQTGEFVAWMPEG